MENGLLGDQASREIGAGEERAEVVLGYFAKGARRD